MRRRQPGFYVSVRFARREGGPGLAGELLDGPWPTRETAEERAAEIEQTGRRPGATIGVVRVASDGITVLPAEAEGD